MPSPASSAANRPMAGASPFGAPLHLHHLPLAAAQALSARLGAQLARRRLQW